MAAYVTIYDSRRFVRSDSTDTTVLLPVAAGGSGANLSGTGGANQFVKQSTAGGAFTVGVLGSGDVPDGALSSNVALLNRNSQSFTGTPQLFADGSASAPSIALINSTGTGLFKAGTNILGISTGGSQRVWIDSSGNVGIGAASIAAARCYIEASGSQMLTMADSSATSSYRGQFQILGQTTDANGLVIGENPDTVTGPITFFQNKAAFINNVKNGPLYFGTNNTLQMTLDSGGRLGLGVAPDASSALRVDSTTGAILIPRMTTTQKNALTAIDGMIVYDTTLGKFQGREAGAWNNFSLL